jgi:hypothetical protein
LATTPSLITIGPQPIGQMPMPSTAFSQMISMQRRQYHVVDSAQPQHGISTRSSLGAVQQTAQVSGLPLPVDSMNE